MIKFCIFFSGLTLGHLLASSYEGDVAKSLILKSKVSEKQSNVQQSNNSKVPDQIYCSMSSFNLSSFELNNVETIWNAYKNDLLYNFDKINNILDTLMTSSKELLSAYNILIDELNKNIEVIDFKKYDLLKVSY